MYDDSKSGSASPSRGRRSTAKAMPRRIYVVVNPNEDGDDDIPVQKQQFYPPPPLPNPQTQLEDKLYSGPPHPGPINTDNLKQKYPHYNTSDRTLSSPSTPASSPAVESTPPPSTPGQKSVPSIDLTQGSDRSDGSQPHVAGRAETLVRRITAPFSHARRKSSTNVVATASPIFQDHHGRERSNSSLNKVLICVTAESDDYKTVDITGARDADFIRERIFARLRISDDDQAHFSIYRTEIGSFALSDALTDNQLFTLCKNNGDSIGTLKFLVSYSSAVVHESPLDQHQSQAVNALPPPPVLPQANRVYSPVSSARRSPSRDRSLSSASEQIQQEGGTGYDASVSDGEDNVERDPNRATIRPTAQKSTTLPSIPQLAIPASLKPHSPPEGTRIVAPEVAPLRLEKSYPTSVPVCQPKSPAARSYADDYIGSWKSPLVVPPDTPIERERAPEPTEAKVEQLDQPFRLQQEREEKERHRKRDAKRHHESQKPRGGGEHWTVIPSDIPHSDYKKERPSAGNDLPRSPPARRGYGEHQSFVGPRNASEGRSKRPVGQPVPFHWAVAWRAPGGKADPKVSPTNPSPLYRGIKSMENLRASAKHPPPLQPGRAPRPPLPLTRPATSGATPDPAEGSLPPGSRWDPRNNITNIASPISTHSSRPLPVAGYSSATSATGFGLTSPSTDPYSRPRSALGDSVSSPFTTRARPIPPSNQRNDTDSTLPSSLSRSPPSILSPHHYGVPTSARSPYGYEGSSNIIPRIVHTAQNGEDRGIDAIIERGATSIATRTPPSPVSPSSPRYSASSEPSPARNSPSENSAESTLKGGRYPWMAPFYEGHSTDGTIIARRERHDIKPLPPHPVAKHAQGHPHSPPPPLPLPPFLSPTTESSTYMPHPSSKSSTYSTTPTPLASTSTVPPPKSVNSTTDDGSDSDSSLWAIGDEISGMGTWQQLPADKRKSMRGPQLTVQIDETTPSVIANGTLPRPPDFAPPEYLPHQRRPPKPTPRPSGSSGSATLIARHPHRTSVFNEDFRPPPEEVYERLGDFFPEHDLDEPVIEATSGGTSPTSVDSPAVPALTQTIDKRKHKKSIRVVANEHKKRLDRNSRATPMASNVLRKRSTKLWGSKLEEVTADQVRDGLNSPHSPGPKPIFKWVRGELIGRGTYGKVYVALNATTGEMIAVKQVEIPRTEADRKDTRQITVVEALKLESETLKDLDHPHVVQYLGFEETPRFLSIFLEYVPGGSVASCLRTHGRFDENVTKSFTGQILDGLEYLHSRGVIHRDLKADNILVESFGLCKISDFGISKRTDDIDMIGEHTSMQGSVFWMAPEVIDSHKKGYNSKIDIWSVGCVVFEMWTGQRPWSGQEVVPVLLQLYQSKLGPPVPTDMQLSSLADDFRRQCFQMNPDERPTATELRQHQYLELPEDWEFLDFV